MKRIERVKQGIEFEREHFDRYGFYIHIVPPKSSKQCNYHTHGVFESFGHLDFQIVLPIYRHVVEELFHTLVNEVKAGKQFKEGIVYYELVRDLNMPMTFKKVWEADRNVLRMLIPDAKGNLPGQAGCDPDFEIQWN